MDELSGVDSGGQGAATRGPVRPVRVVPRGIAERGAEQAGDALARCGKLALPDNIAPDSPLGRLTLKSARVAEPPAPRARPPRAGRTALPPMKPPARKRTPLPVRVASWGGAMVAGAGLALAVGLRHDALWPQVLPGDPRFWLAGLIGLLFLTGLFVGMNLPGRNARMRVDPFERLAEQVRAQR